VDGADHLGESVSTIRRFVAATVFILVVQAAPTASAQDGDPGVVVPPPSRDVTPSGATRAPPGDGPLLREAVPPPPPDPPRWRRFFLPATIDAATFKAGDLTIRISGVTPPTADQTCPATDGEAWPCGRTALFALRMFLRGRAVECYFPRPDGVADITAPCRVGKTDLGMWLLEQGWVKPDAIATDDYRKAARRAECVGRGLWRGISPTDCATSGD
jgi:endonuclease YncB( thermonuclease family)